MKFLTKTGLFLAFGILSACAQNKGGFETNVVTPPPKEVPPPRFQDDTSAANRPDGNSEENSLDTPALGYEIKIPNRNFFRQTQKQALLNAGNIQATEGNDLNIPHQAEIAKHPKIDDSEFHTHDGTTESHKRNMQYVRSGYIYRNRTGMEIVKSGGATSAAYVGPVGYLYYKGVNPSASLPVGHKIQYEGTWDFVTSAVAGKTHAGFGDIPSDRYGVVSGMDQSAHGNSLGDVTEMNGKRVLIGYTSHLEVDFANKELKGKLRKNTKVHNSQQQQKHIDIYDLQAALTGNRFKGVAKVHDFDQLDGTQFDDEDKARLKNLFSKDSSSLEGGFFGPNGEELAGKFLADDQNLFAVFAAKRTADPEKTIAIADAVNINRHTFEHGTMDTFGNATRLIIGNRSFSLLPKENAQNLKGDFVKQFEIPFNTHAGDQKLKLEVCCSNLGWLKFGSYGLDDTYSHFFLVGERSSLNDVASKQGKVHYHGTWAAEFQGADKRTYEVVAGKGVDKGKAEFIVNFGDKTLTGELTAQNHTQASLKITGDIKDNGFIGKANTLSTGFKLDAQGALLDSTVHIKDAEVKGGFYGPDAIELGGVIKGGTADQGLVNGVFGAKRQIISHQ